MIACRRLDDFRVSAKAMGWSTLEWTVGFPQITRRAS